MLSSLLSERIKIHKNGSINKTITTSITKTPIPILKTTVGNIGVNDATNVDWSINIQGGLLQLIDKTINGQIETLNIGNQESITANKAIIGLGEVNIIVLANDAAKVEKGFILGPFIIIS